jgi:hypothetical protein
MSTGPAVRRWYQFSLRWLLLVTAVLALLLVPVAWVAREREQMLRARAEALRAVVLAERARSQLEKSWVAGRADSGPAADAAGLIEQLRRENAELKRTIERLRREVERLEGRIPPGSIPSQD